MKQRTGRENVHIAILLYLLIFLALDIGVWAWFVLHRHVLGHQFPLGDRSTRFGDLLLFSGEHQVWKDPRMPNFDNLGGTLYPRNYLPFAVAIYLFLLQVCAPYAVPVMLGAVFAALTVACILLWRKLRQMKGYRWYIGAAVFLTGFFGWGTEQVAMRGNIEGILWIFVCLGAAYYTRRKFYSAGAAFGLATCIKPYPVLWFALMLRHRKIREAAFGLATAAFAGFVSLFAVDSNPLRAYQAITGKSSFFADYIVSFRPMEEMKGDHSLLQSIKTIARIIRNHGLHFTPREFGLQSNDPLAWKLYEVYLPLAVLIGAVTVWRVWNKPVLNQIFALATITTLLPVVAGDYTLIVLLVPMGFFIVFLLQDVVTEKTQLSLGKIVWFLIPCAWLMATEPLSVLHGVLKCAALLVLLMASIAIPLPSTLFRDGISPRSAR